MTRYLLTLALRAVTALQTWFWERIALGGAAKLQLLRESIIRRLM